MRIIFSRKGFDSASGRAPSPIIDRVPYALPIPTGKYPSETTYGHLSLGDKVSQANKGYTADSLCHEDPMFWDDRCAFGQTSASQSHLSKNGVGVGDVFIFFGLFAEGNHDRHHRIFGYLNVESVFKIGAHPSGEELWHALEGACRKHPHTIEEWESGGK
jgi:Nucleotide modification associated domain 3